MLDAAAGGTLMAKTEGEAHDLIEEMTLINYQWFTKRRQLKRVGDKFDVGALALLTVEMDAMTQRLDRLNVNAVNAYASSSTCDSCGSRGLLIVILPSWEPLCPILY